MAWDDPKTDWAGPDQPVADDMNRIEGNIAVLADAAAQFNLSPIKSGDGSVGDLMSWIEENNQWEKHEFGQPYNGSSLVAGGLFVWTSFFDAADVGYRLYRQADGTMSTAVRAAEYYIGYVLDENSALINILGGVNKTYLDNMVGFLVVPAASNELWLKLEMPATANGVMLRRSTSAYDDSGITWGDEVEDITDDTGYFGDNNWYIDDDGGTGLTNDVVYYYKAFPYLGSVYNITDGDNEDYATCKNGLGFYSFDNLSGSVAVDDYSTNDITGANVAYDTGKVEDAADFNGTNAQFSRALFLSNKFTFTGLYYRSGSISEPVVSESYYSGFDDRGWVISISATNVVLTTGDGGNTQNPVSIAYTFATSNWYTIGIEVDKTAKKFKLWVNGVYIDESTASSISVNLSGCTFYLARRELDGSTYGEIILDQVRFHENSLSDHDHENIHNGGAGC